MIVVHDKIFRKTEKQSFTFPTIIEERKESRSYIPWIFGLIVLAIVIIFFFEHL